MKNRRNVRKNEKRKITINLNNKGFFIMVVVLILISLSLVGVIKYKSYKEYQNNILLAEQKEELKKQTQDIFIDMENTINDSQGSNIKTVKLTAVGDILCGEDMIRYAKEGKENYNFNSMFSNVSKYVKDSDISIGTLETNFTDSNYSGTGKYNSPIEFLDAIKESGINLLSVAQNHELDYGIDGLNQTLKNIQNKDVDIIGIKNNINNSNADFTGYIKEVNEVKIAFLAYTYGVNNEGVLSQEEKEYANIYSEEKFTKDMEYAKENSNYIITIMHWGDVNNSNITEEQKSISEYLINNGVDMILGSHPSIVQKMEIRQNKEGRNILVAYSLGNYISSFKNENSEVELLLNIQLAKNKDDNKATLKKVDYIPIYVLDENNNNRFELNDMKDLAIEYASGNREKISNKTYNKIINKIDWLEKIINGG